LQPNEVSEIEVWMDSRAFIGPKTRTIYVLLEQPRFIEYRIWVSANSCENQTTFPDTFDFGTITQGAVPTRRVIVAVPNQPKLQITKAACDSKHIELKTKEVARGPDRVVYEVSATIRADAPPGELFATVELSTNNPAMPRLLVQLSVQVESRK
jgi:hypothetical protein